MHMLALYLTEPEVLAWMALWTRIVHMHGTAMAHMCDDREPNICRVQCCSRM